MNTTDYFRQLLPFAKEDKERPFHEFLITTYDKKLESWKVTEEEDEKPNKKTQQSTETIDTQLVENCILALTSTRAEEYASWRNVCFTINNIVADRTEAGRLIHLFSKRTSKPHQYNKEDIDQWLTTLEPTEKGYSMTSIRKWVKEDNPSAFKPYFSGSCFVFK